MIINHTLSPGDKLEIDTDKGTITINGEEVHDIDGEIFNLPPGTSSIEYSDSESSRDLKLTVEFTKRNV